MLCPSAYLFTVYKRACLALLSWFIDWRIKLIWWSWGVNRLRLDSFWGFGLDCSFFYFYVCLLLDVVQKDNDTRKYFTLVWFDLVPVSEWRRSGMIWPPSVRLLIGTHQRIEFGEYPIRRWTVKLHHLLQMNPCLFNQENVIGQSIMMTMAAQGTQLTPEPNCYTYYSLVASFPKAQWTNFSNVTLIWDHKSYFDPASVPALFLTHVSSY
jgi:hypothetical protein